MYTGIVALIVSTIAFMQANSARASKSIATIALAISIASIAVGYWRYNQIKDAATFISNEIDSLKNKNNTPHDSLKKVTESVKTDTSSENK